MLIPVVPAFVPIVWTTMYEQSMSMATPTVDPAGTNFSTYVTRFNDAGQDALFNRYRVTLYTGNLAGNASGALVDMYLGEAPASGDAFDFASSPAPVQVTFGGSGAPALVTPNLTIVSDEVTFSGGSRDLMISFAVNSNVTALPYQDSQGTIVTYRRQSVSQSSTVNKSSYSAFGTNRVMLISKVEGRTAA